MLSGELARAGIQTYALSVAALVANLVSGIVIARALAPDGRGEAVAIAMLAQNVGAAVLARLRAGDVVPVRARRRRTAGGS